MSESMLRIIDVHTHTEFDGNPDECSGIAATLDQYLMEREHAGVVGGLTDSARPSTAVSDYTKYNIVRCAVVEKIDFDLESIAAGLEGGLFRAIKINLGFIHAYATDPRFAPVYALAQKHDVPVLFHTGAPGWDRAKLKYADPLTIDDVAVDFDSTKFVIVHSGNPWFKTAAEVADKNPNVYIEASALVVGGPDDLSAARIQNHLVAPLEWIHGYIGDPSKLMFGSGWPMVDLKTYVEGYKRAIPRDRWQAVFHDNAARLFRLSF